MEATSEGCQEEVRSRRRGLGLGATSEVAKGRKSVDLGAKLEVEGGGRSEASRGGGKACVPSAVSAWLEGLLGAKRPCDLPGES